jgi:hypothetical protein
LQVVSLGVHAEVPIMLSSALLRCSEARQRDP